MFRRLTAACVARTAAASCATRSMMIFSEQHPVLANNQKGFGFESNVWVEEWDVKSHSFPTTLRSDQSPTAISGLKSTIKFFNLAQIEVPPPGYEEEPAEPSSMITRLPFSRTMAADLLARKEERGFTSNWFCSNGFLIRNSLRLKGQYRDVKPVIVPMNAKAKVYNASQFENMAAVEQSIVSGGSRAIYGRQTEFYTALKEHREQNNFRTGLYFSERQLSELQLPVKASAIGCSFSTTSNMLLYNIEAIVDWELLKAREQRANPETHTFFFTGREISSTMTEQLDSMSYSQRLWVSSWDLTKHKLKPVEDAPSIPYVPANQSNIVPLAMYNVEQLENPTDGFTKAGLCLQ